MKTEPSGHHFSSEPQRDGFEELLTRYVAELPPQVEHLAEACASGDDEACRSRLHRLAGSLGLYGYRQLEGRCRALLARLQAGESCRQIDDSLTALLSELERVRARPD